MQLSYTIKRIIFPLLQTLFKNLTYTVRNGLSKGLKRKGGLGFIPQISKMTKEEQFLMSLDLKGKTVYDIGGYIGITTIFFARAVGERGKVITFEPNPANYSKIGENVELNGFSNVQVFNTAIGSRKDMAQFIFEENNDARGRVMADKVYRNTNGGKVTILKVEVDSLDSIIETRCLDSPSFIKIDVEGLELDVLVGMSKTMVKNKPQLFIEIHGSDMLEKLENIKRVVDYLQNHSYSIYHVESGRSINSSNSECACRGHIYCR